MASKKFLELQEFTDVELVNKVKEMTTEFSNTKFDHAIKGLDNPLIIREMRKDLARLKTEVRRREVAKLDEAGLAKRSKIRARRRK